jgi:hypothetical protein
MRIAVLISLAAMAAWSQQLDQSSLDKLESRSKERSIIDLDPEKLRMASGLLPDDAAAKMAGMKAVHVRNYEFDKPGQVTPSDLDGVRSQLKGPSWSRLVDVKEKDESTEIWFHSENGKMGGLAILSVEKDELTVVNIIGPVDLKSLGMLGKLGIPDIQSNFGGPGQKNPPNNKPAAPKDEDEE